jgi:hypothetical protein
MKNNKMIVKIVEVVIPGIKDGWREPYDLSTSTNIDHIRDLVDDEEFLDCIELLDMSINIGQLLRAGGNSQPFVNSWWPTKTIKPMYMTVEKWAYRAVGKRAPWDYKCPCCDDFYYDNDNQEENE